MERFASRMGDRGWRMVSTVPSQGAMVVCFTKRRERGEVLAEGAATPDLGRYFNDNDLRELARRLVNQPCIGGPTWLPKGGGTVRFAPPVKRTSDRNVDMRVLADRLMVALRKDSRARLVEPAAPAKYTVRLSLSSNTDSNGGREVRAYYATVRVTTEQGEVLCINTAQVKKVYQQKKVTW